MRQPRTTGRFERDYSQMVKRGKQIDKLDSVMMMQINEDALPPRNRDHALDGNFKGFRDCHIEPDWLLIYKVEGDVITFERTGTHSDIFR
ncbi:MAG: type II toxin-antitoxin system YafQ family toxin [Desulfuromonadales bacterium]